MPAQDISVGLSQLVQCILYSIVSIAFFFRGNLGHNVLLYIEPFLPYPNQIVEAYSTVGWTRPCRRLISGLQR